MKRLVIKTFMKDSQRPEWLIKFLYEVKQYAPTDLSNQESVYEWLKNTLRDTTLVKRSKSYSAIDCVCVEETSEHLLISSAYKYKPIVEFTIETV